MSADTPYTPDELDELEKMYEEHQAALEEERHRKEYVVLNAEFSLDLLQLAQEAIAIERGISSDSVPIFDEIFEALEWATWVEDNPYFNVSSTRLLGWSGPRTERMLVMVEFQQLTDLDAWSAALREEGLGVSLWSVSAADGTESEDQVTRLMNAIEPGELMGAVSVKLPRTTVRPEGKRMPQFSESVATSEIPLFELLGYPGPREFQRAGMRRPARPGDESLVPLSCERHLGDGSRETVRVTLDQTVQECLGSGTALVHTPRPEQRPRQWLAFAIAPVWSAERARAELEGPTGVTHQFPSPEVRRIHQIAPDAWVFEIDTPSLD